ncbi:MAG: twin-arginine translocase TatA/TatE family subunit [Planctomycetales bacterium]|nr:twin-arginine translocase TatA/TatE family subunit [Planctomycetales bacterium]
MFGIGPWELLMVLVIAIFVVGVPIAIIVLLVFLMRNNDNRKTPMDREP